MTPDTQLLLALLVLGHVIGDFVFQSRAMVAGKLAWAPGAFARHTAAVGACHALTLLPVFPGWQNAGWIVAVTGAHLATDLGKTALSKTWPRPVTWFAVDQALHVAALVAIARRLDPTTCTLADELVDPAFLVAVYAATLLFQTGGGSALVSIVLGELRSDHGQPDPATTGPAAIPGAGDLRGAGHRIGVLERLLITLAVAHGQWAAVGLVLTAKSIARFKELEDKQFSEIYLVGTMTSVLVAIAGGLALAHLVPPITPAAP